MSEDSTVSAAESAPEESNTPTTSEQTEESGSALDSLPDGFEWVKDELTKARREAAKYRTRAKEFADDETYEAARSAMTRVQEIEESQKSEIQKANEAREAAEKSAEDTARNLAVERAARQHGLSDEALNFLSGVPAEEVEEKAQSLASLVAQRSGPKPDPTQGSTAASAPATAADQFASAVGAFLK